MRLSLGIGQNGLCCWLLAAGGKGCLLRLPLKAAMRTDDEDETDNKIEYAQKPGETFLVRLETKTGKKTIIIAWSNRNKYHGNGEIDNSEVQPYIKRFLGKEIKHDQRKNDGY